MSVFETIKRFENVNLFCAKKIDMKKNWMLFLINIPSSNQFNCFN